NNEVTPSSEVAGITYFVKAIDTTGNWFSNDTTSFSIIVNGVYSLTMDGVFLGYKLEGTAITGVVEAENGSFVDKLVYTGLEGVTETFGSAYNFQMPASNVTITSQKSTIGSTLFVTADGAGDRNGYSWNNAADALQLQTMLNTTGVTEVRVAGGVYEFTATINVPKGIKIVGSWDITTDSQKMADGAINSWDFASVTTFKSSAAITLTLNQISACDAIYFIESNRAINTARSDNSCKFEITRCLFTGNQANGSLVYIAGSSNNTMIISECGFIKNSATSIIEYGNVNVNLKNSRFTNNITTAQLLTGSAQKGYAVEQCIFNENQAGIALLGNTTISIPAEKNISSSTFYANTAPYIIAATTGSVVNCVAFNNTVSTSIISSGLTVTNSAYIGASDNNNIDLTDIVVADLFTNAADGDLSLTANSILINSGSNN
ncbi:MAG: hypothetical protein ACRC37_08055, partial [Lentisphaeria bacterium]